MTPTNNEQSVFRDGFGDLTQVSILLQGVGWRAEFGGPIKGGGSGESDGSDGSPRPLTLFLGYSHGISVGVPRGIAAAVLDEKNSREEVRGTRSLVHYPKVLQQGNLVKLVASAENKVALGDFAASLMKLRPYNPYSGHGLIVLNGRPLARKAGKRKG